MTTSRICSTKYPALWLGSRYAGAGLVVAGLTVAVVKGLRLGDPAVGSTLGAGALLGGILGALTSVAATQGCRR